MEKLDKKLMIAAENGNYKKVAKLLQKGASVRYKTNHGLSPLHLAAENGHYRTVKIILQHGCDPSEQDDNGYSPLHLSVEMGHYTTANVLLQAGTCPTAQDKDKNTPLHIAVWGGCLKIIGILLQMSVPEEKDRWGWTPLHVAAWTGQDTTVKVLLQNGFNPLMTNCQGNTPLHLAAARGHSNVVELLIHAGSDQSGRNNKGDTPIKLAIKRGQFKTVKLLLKAGSDLSSLQDPSDETEPIPEELTELGFASSDAFQDIIRLGSYQSFWNRVYIVGPFSTGKSTLAKILVGEIPSEIRESTDGIWIYIGRAGMNVKKKEWICFPKGNLMTEIIANMLMSLKTKACDTSETDRQQEKQYRSFETGACDDDAKNDKSSNEDVFEVIDGPNLEAIYENLPPKRKASDYGFKDCPNSEAIYENLPPKRKASDDGLKSVNFSSEISTVHTIPEGNQESFENDILKGALQTDLSHEKIRELILKTVKEGKYQQQIIPVDIWDFGGQKDYYMTHQLFLSSRGIYVLMFNGSVDLDKHMLELSFLPGHYKTPTVAVYLLHWVNSILTYCIRTENGFPRIVFVATHKDEIPVKKIESRRQKLISSLRQLFSSHASLAHLEFEKLIFIDARDENDLEINALRQILLERAFENPRWGEEMPTVWVPLELQLIEQTENGHNILSRRQLLKLNSQNKTMVLSEQQLETFLKVQHSLGKLLYFDDEYLRDFIIINPAYMVNVLRSIVTDERFWSKVVELRDILSCLQLTGMIKRYEIYAIWHQDQFIDILPYKEYIIAILVHLDVLVASCSHLDLNTSASNAEEFIVPCMVTAPNNTKYLTKFCNSTTSITMAYTFQEEVIPPAMIFRFLGSCINMWGIKSYKGKIMLYSDLCVLEVDKCHDLVVQTKGNSLLVSLVHVKKKENIVPTVASSIQECLTATIHKISEFYSALSEDKRIFSSKDSMHSKETEEHMATANGSSKESTPSCPHFVMPFRIEFGVHCQQSFFSKTDVCLFPHGELPTLRPWKCPNHKKKHEVQSLSLWFAEKCTSETCKENCQGLGLMQLEQRPLSKHLRRLTSKLEIEKCRQLILELGIDFQLWKDLEYKFQHQDPEDLKFVAVFKWKEQNKSATFLQLQSALTKCDEDQHLLCKVFHDIQPDIAEYDDETLYKIPSTTSLAELSRHIGNSVMQLGIELDIDVYEMEHIRYQFRKNLLNQTKELLKRWRNKKSPKPTVLNLIKALHRIGKLSCLHEIKF